MNERSRLNAKCHYLQISTASCTDFSLKWIHSRPRWWFFEIKGNFLQIIKQVNLYSSKLWNAWNFMCLLSILLLISVLIRLFRLFFCHFFTHELISRALLFCFLSLIVAVCRLFYIFMNDVLVCERDYNNLSLNGIDVNFFSRLISVTVVKFLKLESFFFCLQ